MQELYLEAIARTGMTAAKFYFVHRIELTDVIRDRGALWPHVFEKN